MVGLKELQKERSKEIKNKMKRQNQQIQKIISQPKENLFSLIKKRIKKKLKVKIVLLLPVKKILNSKLITRKSIIQVILDKQEIQ